MKLGFMILRTVVSVVWLIRYIRVFAFAHGYTNGTKIFSLLQLPSLPLRGSEVQV